MTTAEEKRGKSPPMRTLVTRILAEADREALRSVIAKSIAVSSGKGGVGKTITACNLAITYARKGLRVGLADLDPLSDVASLLDIHESEQALQGQAGGKENGFEDCVLPVFRKLEILFPFQKLRSSEVSDLMDKIYRTYLRQIDGRYDVLIFDMPAGMEYEANLAYLPFMKRLVLVTNPEPTAHASAGAYAKEVQRLYPGKIIQLWHNRFSRKLREDFHPSDVAGNYNRFVDESDRLTEEESALLLDFAFIPEDPALDLLQGEPNPAIHVLTCMRESLDYAHGRLIAQASARLGIPRRIRDVVSFYIHRHPRIGDAGAYIAELGEYTAEIVRAVTKSDKDAATDGVEPFTPEEITALEGFLKRVTQSALRNEILKLEELLDVHIRRIEESRGTFSSRLQLGQDRAIDREMGRFLTAVNKSARASAVMRNHGALLLFYFSLHKLFQSKTLVLLLKSLIPRRTDRRGRKVRDRFRQIQILVESDAGYRARYLRTMRTLNMIVRRQLETVADAFELKGLLLLNQDSSVDGRAYLKLLAAFLHETLYSGLSVIVGFDYRAAAAAFQDAAERLLASLSPVEKPAHSRERMRRAPV
jgi:cellulose biosynthesis protein BcsQ